MNSGERDYLRKMQSLIQSLLLQSGCWCKIFSDGVKGPPPKFPAGITLEFVKKRIAEVAERSTGHALSAFHYSKLTVDMLRDLEPSQFHEALVGLNDYIVPGWDLPVSSAFIVANLCVIHDVLELYSADLLLAGESLDTIAAFNQQKYILAQKAITVLVQAFGSPYNDREALRAAYDALQEPVKGQLAARLPVGTF